MRSLKTALHDFAEECCKETGSLSTAQMKELFKLALTGVRQTKRLSPSIVQSVWEPTTWIALQQNVKTSPRFNTSPVLPKMCEQVARMSQNSDEEKSKPTKRKADQVNGDDAAGKESKKSKRKKIKGDA